MAENFNRARDHLANERTFLAWVRTSQSEEGKLEPAGFIVDLVTILTVLFGLVLAGYSVYVSRGLG